MSAEDRKELPDLPDVERAYRALGDSEPPNRLDRAVLDSARRTGRAWGWNLGWSHTLATAAVLLLAVSVILDLEQGERGLGDRSGTGELREMSAPPAVQRSDRELSRDGDAPARSEPLEDDARVSGQRRAAGISENVSAPAEPRASAHEAEEQQGRDTPEARLQSIRALRDAGAFDRARSELREFRRTWPDHPLPDDLAPLLDTVPGG